MRIKINLYANNVLIPNNNQHIINSYIHKCLGFNNNYHDTYSNYSISLLQGGILNKEDKNILINNDAYIIVSSFDSTFINTLIMGIMKNKSFYQGINIGAIEPLFNDIIYNGFNHFTTLSPFLIKSDNKDITIDDFSSLKEMSIFIESILLKKLKIINEKNNLNLNFDNFNFSITWCHTIKRFIKPNCRGFKVNNCGFTLTSSKEIAELLYNIGIGQSTGAGFGCIYKSENKFFYRNKKIA